MTVLILLNNSSELDQVWQKKYQVDNEENSSAFLKKKKKILKDWHLALQLRCDLGYILRKQPHSKQTFRATSQE